MTRKSRRNNKTKKSQIIQRNLIRNIVVILVLIVFLFVIYRFNFSSKSELTETVKINFKEFGENISLEEQELDIEVLTDADGVKYIFLPEKINGYFVQQYHITNVEGNNITNSLEELDSTNTLIENIVLETNTIDEVAGLKKYYLTSQEVETEKKEENQVNENKIEDDVKDDKKEENIVSNTDESNSNTTVQNSVTNEIVKDDNQVQNVVKNENQNATTQNTIQNTTEKNEIEEDKKDGDIQDNFTDDTIIETGVKPGTRYNVYETNEKGKYALGNILVEVEYQTITNEEIKLYNQELTFKDEASEITVTGYIPAEYELNCIKENSNELENQVNEYEDLKDYQMLCVYDISIEKDGNVYQPENYDWAPRVSVNIQSTDLNSLPNENDVKLIHFADSIETIEGFETEANSIEFSASGFSKYAVLSKRSITETTVTIDTYDEDKNYYLGKNYTDNISGENSNIYSEDNLANVTINYHSMPESNFRNDNVEYKREYALSSDKGKATDYVTEGNKRTFPCTLTLAENITIGDNWEVIIDFTPERNLEFEILRNSSEFYEVCNEGKQIKLSSNYYHFSNNQVHVNIIAKRLNSTQAPNIGNITLHPKLVEKMTYSYEYIISNDKTGYISATERQNLVTYHKAVPVNNGQIELELIDNPFMDRPVGNVHEEYSNGRTEDYQTLFGFNGWKNKSNVSYTINTNENTYQQTLKIENVDDKNNVVIDLYVDWIPANVVFVKDGGTGDGKTLATPAGTWTEAIEILKNSQKSANYASNREVNIIVVIGALSADSKLLVTEIPYTVTSLYDGIDYRINQNATITLNKSIRLTNDLQLEYLNVIGSQNYIDTRTKLDDGMKYINGNSYNLRIGRGMIPLNCDRETSTFGQIQCGGQDNKEFKTVVESGRYSNIYVDRAAENNVNFSMNGTLILGTDIDRELQDGNSNLQIYSYITSRRNISKNTALDTNKPIYDIYIKSGTVGIDCFESHPDAAYSGIYLSGNSGESATDYDVGERRLTIEGGKIANIIGGLKTYSNDKNATTTCIYVKGNNASIQNIIGGCVKIKTSSDRIIQVTGGTVEYSIFSGSNGRESTQGDIGSLDGNTLVYVGGDAKIGGNNRLIMNGTDGGDSLYGLQYGCILGAGNGNSSVDTAGVVNSSHIIIAGEAIIENNVYGGGNFAGVSGNTQIDMYGGTVEGTVHGGSKGTTVHGGSNDIGKITGDANINITGGTINGNVTDEDSITTAGEIKEHEAIFAGGYGLTTTVKGNTNINISDKNGNVNINGNIYGGSAMGRVDQKANITIKQENSNKIKISGNIFGGGKGSQEYPSSNGSDITVTIDGGEYTSIFGGANTKGYINGNINIDIGGNLPTKVDSVFGGGNNADLIDGNSNSLAGAHEDNINLGKFATIDKVFNGGNNASINKEFKLKLDVTGSTITNVYGGGNLGIINGSTLLIIKENANIDTIHGGGKNGNVSENTEVTISNSTIKNVYGGGENGQIKGSSKVSVNEKSNIIENIYGAGEGDNATVEGNTEVSIDDITAKNIYGGGKLGDVNGQTQVKITSSIIKENAYGAGRGQLGDNDKDNGRYATVKKSKIVIEGNTTIKGNVFGGGNASNVGEKGILETDTRYIEGCDAEVYISGAVIGTDAVEGTEASGGNVYGGSNRSKIWGNTKIYIGNLALDQGYQKGIIDIKGTVFGGGESRTDSTNFDYTFRSVHGDIEIHIDANEYDLNIRENIYGSGNASSAIKDGNIYINDFGNETDIKKIKSIQRATNVIINNSELQLLGDTNSTNIHETTLYSLTNIKELTIKNDTTLYLEYGAYALSGFSSLKYNDEPAEVTIENEILNIDGNNKIYTYNGQHLDVTNATGDTYGNVKGMTFFGQYRYDSLEKIDKGIYGDKFINHTVDKPTWNEREFTQSYVLGAHTTDLEKMGFYTVYEDLTPDAEALKERGELKEDNYEAEGYHIDYIVPTPNDDKIAYDYWHTGFVTDIINIDLELTASKYSTLGVVSKQLTGAEKYPNATLVLDSFSISSGLEGKKFVKTSEIANIETNTDKANNTFGLLMKTSNNGWIDNSSTEFLLNPEIHHSQIGDEDINYKFSENPDETYKGDSTYLSGSLPDSVAPTLEFYLYNSNTLTLPIGEIGTYILRMTLTCTANNKYVIVPVIINIKITASDEEEIEGYNGVTTPGKKYDIFPQMATNITDNSSFSTYFELARKKEENKVEYESGHRVINTGFALPQNTTITMIDKSEGNPAYYYYTVTGQDEIAQKDEFRLEDFIYMGTDDNTKKYVDKAYYINDYKYECFIFIVDFANANFNGMQGKITNSPKMEIKLMIDSSEQPIYRLISSQQNAGRTVYDIFGTTSELKASSKISNSSIYIGNTSTLTIESSLITQSTIIDESGSKNINVYNTQYFDKKLGAEIRVFDKSGNQISDLKGTTFQVEEIREVDGEKKKGYNTYTPYNGIIRLKLADIFSNTSIPVIINTKNTTNDFANRYDFEIKVFASADGVYSGNEKMSEPTREEISFISNEYGLNTTIPENQVIINKATSTTLDENGYLSDTLKDLDLHIEYKYSVANPYLTISLARRDYSGENDISPKYISEGIDLAAYLVPEGEKTLKLVSDMGEEKKAIEYEALSTQEMIDASKDASGKRTVDLHYQIKDDLSQIPTGTYRLTVTLYDIKDTTTQPEENTETGNTVSGETTEDTEKTPEEKYQYIGDVYSYIIIK